MKPLLLIRPDHNEADAGALAEVGIASVTEPLLQIVPVADSGPARALAHRLSEADSLTWLVVTSPRTWKRWQIAVTELDSVLTEALARGLNVATVGAKTASSLPAAARDRTIIPSGISAEDMLGFLLEQTPGTALLPASARARRVLPDGLTAAGWQVQQAAIYGTVARRDVRLPALDGLGGVVVRSASAASALANLVPQPPGDFTVFAVGPVTSCRCRDLGWQPVEISSTQPGAVARAIAGHLRADGGMLEQ